MIYRVHAEYLGFAKNDKMIDNTSGFTVDQLWNNYQLVS